MRVEELQKPRSRAADGDGIPLVKAVAQAEVFVDSVAEQFEDRGRLTEKQITALENIRDMLLNR